MKKSTRIQVRLTNKNYSRCLSSNFSSIMESAFQVTAGSVAGVCYSGELHGQLSQGHTNAQALRQLKTSFIEVIRGKCDSFRLHIFAGVV